VPPKGNWTSRPRITGVYDKGKGALVVMETEMIDESGEVAVVSVSSTFIRGIGGFGGARGPAVEENVKIPSRAPDISHAEKTSEHQAWIYRLSADYNPLHIDPGVAEMAGFKRPILHGLCSFGFAARAILKNCCANDPKKFKSIRVRFVSPVYPGETLVTEMWKESQNRIVFQVKVQERNVVVIGNAVAMVSSEPTQVVTPSSEPPILKSSVVFAAMKQAIEKHPDLIEKVKTVYQFNITGSHPTTYTLDLKNGKGDVYEGTPKSKPDCVMTISDDDYFDMATGKFDGQTAFLKGKLKISGNIMLAQKLNIIQQAAAKL